VPLYNPRRIRREMRKNTNAQLYELCLTADGTVEVAIRTEED
jgi:hypothetical protein